MVWYPDCLVVNKKDEGYAYVIVLASFLVRTTLFGMVYASGIYYVAILKDLKTSNATAAWVGSILIAFVSVASMLSSVLLNRYGARFTCAISAVISSFGLIASVFSTSIYYLIVSYGIICGTGMGIALIPSVVSIAEYFDKWKHIAQSLASSGSSFGTFIGPILVERLISYYGWRGSMLVCSAIVLNLGAFGLLFRPFYENSKLPLMCVQGSTADIKVVNWAIFKHKGFILACFANTGVSFSSSVIVIHLSAYAQFDVGISPQRAAVLLSLIGIMGIPARLSFGLLISKRFPPCGIIMVSSVTVGLATLCLPYIRWFPGLVIYSVITGSFISANGGAVWPAMVTGLLGDANLSNSMGALNLVCAMGNLAGPPIAGWLFDQTKTYEYSFLMGGCVSVVSGAMISVVWWLSSPSHQRHRALKKLMKEELLVVERLTCL